MGHVEPSGKRYEQDYKVLLLRKNSVFSWTWSFQITQGKLTLDRDIDLRGSDEPHHRALLSRQGDGQHSPKSRVDTERDFVLAISEGNNSGTNGIIHEALTRLSSSHNSEDSCPRCCTDCEDLSVRGTITGDDDPPPYSALIPYNHVWSYEFLPDIGYTTGCRSETPLESFQQRLTSSNTETCSDRSRTHSPNAIPLTAYGIYKEYLTRSASGSSSPENFKIAKVFNLPRRYGTILVAVICVLSLMALSLIVRLVVERSFWRA